MKSYSGFCELLALDKAQAYLVSRQAQNIQDWGSYELDAEGLALQSELEERLKVRTWKKPRPIVNVYRHHVTATASPSDKDTSCAVRGPGRPVYYRVPGYLRHLGGRIPKHPGRFAAFVEVGPS